MADAAVENLDLHVLRPRGAARNSEGRKRRSCTVRRVRFRRECLWFCRAIVFFWNLSSCFAHVRVPPYSARTFNPSSVGALASLATCANLLADRAKGKRKPGRDRPCQRSPIKLAASALVHETGASGDWPPKTVSK